MVSRDDSLEATGALSIREHPWRVFFRGCTKRCPVCGQGHLFETWFRIRDRCPRCNLRFERIEGHFSGDIGVNTIVSFGALMIVLMVGFLAFWPTPPIVPIIVLALAIAGIMPLAFLPFSKTIWLALDLLMRPLETGEVRPGYGPQ